MGFDELIAEFDDLKLFTPGPTYVSRELMVAAARMPNFSHRDEEIVKRLNPIYTNLKKIAGIDEGYCIILIPGSGSSAMEASIVSLVGDDEKVLSVSCGSFGDLYYNMALANRKNAEKLSFAPGKGIDLNILENKLKEMERNGEKPSVVTFTHNETSTGVMVNVEEVSKVIKKYGAMPLVDGVSIFGGAETGIKDNNVAMYSAATQKCLALDAGFGIAIVSDDALEKAQYLKQNNKCFPASILDISRHNENASRFQTMSTPNCTLINALYLQTDYIVNTEGVEARFARHKEMKEITHNWITELGNGFQLFPHKEYASDSVTALQTPKGFTTRDLTPIKGEVRKEGYLMSTGLPPMNRELEKKGEGVLIRIPHMGDITKDMLKTYLGVLKTHLLMGGR